MNRLKNEHLDCVLGGGGSFADEGLTDDYSRFVPGKSDKKDETSDNWDFLLRIRLLGLWGIQLNDGSSF